MLGMFMTYAGVVGIAAIISLLDLPAIVGPLLILSSCISGLGLYFMLSR
jgi:hypothetical protein